MASALCDSALTIGISPQKFIGKRATVVAVAALLALSGCGGDDQDPPSTVSETAPAETEAPETATVEAPTETEPPEPEPETETETAPADSPEEDEGGAGDEEPARTLALFTARGGRITPRVVRVPAFIQVRVELRSADGETYGLRFGDTTITAGGELSSVSTRIDGLRQGEAVVGRPTGAGNSVRVEATAEPGP
jgi:hypothetical protein